MPDPRIYGIYLGIISFIAFCIWKVVSNPIDKLASAVESGDLDTVKNLMQKGINPDICHPGRATPLYLAAQHGELQMAELLVEYGADINNGLHTHQGWNPLLAAAVNKHPEVVEFLKGKGAKEGLHYWAYCGDNHQVQSLLNQGDPIANTRNWGLSPLLLAVLNKQKSTIELLLAHGADIAAEKPLLYAVDQGDLDMIDFLLEQGANINAENFRTPLTLAIFLNQLTTVKYLIEKGADVNFRSPLESAAWDGYTDIAKVLLENGAEVDLCSSHGSDPPLHTAVIRGHFEVVELLIEYGANVNSLSIMGQTPLGVAKNYPEIYYLLLHHGAEDFSPIDMFY